MSDRISIAWNRRGSHWLRTSLVVAFTLTALMMAPLAAYADAWEGTRYCNSFETCRVRSYATGDVVHKRCETTLTNCVVKGSWSNGTTFTWRTSLHGSGSQGVVITATDTLSQQAATCDCLSPPCPDRSEAGLRSVSRL